MLRMFVRSCLYDYILCTTILGIELLRGILVLSILMAEIKVKGENTDGHPLYIGYSD